MTSPSQSSRSQSSSSSKSYVEVFVAGEDINKEVQKLKDRNKQLVEHIHSLNGKVVDTEIKLRHEQKKYDTHVKSKCRIAQEKEDMMATLVKENDRKDMEIEYLRERSITQTKMIQTLENEVKALKEDAASLESELENLRGKSEAKSSVEDQLNEQANDLYTAKKDIELLTKKVQEIAAMQTSRDDENFYLREEMERNRHEIQTLTDSVSSLTAHMEQQKYEDRNFRESVLSKLNQKEEDDKFFWKATLESLSNIQNNQTKSGQFLPKIDSSYQRQPQRHGFHRYNASITKTNKPNGNRFNFY